MKTHAFRLAFLACMLAPATAAIAGNMTLVLDGVPAVQVSGFENGVSNPASIASGGGGGAGKADFRDFTFRATQSSASPTLFLYVAQGKHIQSGSLQVRSSDGARLLSEWAFNDALLTGFTVNNGPVEPKSKAGDMFLAPETLFSLAFAKICYRVYAADGTTVTTEACWNIKTNSES